MAGRIELPFLYQTRTILGRSRKILISNRRLVSSQQGVEDITGNSSLSPSPEPEPFLKAKARGSNWASSAGKPTAKDSGSAITIPSTITASERRAFEAILRFAPKHDGSKGVNQRSPHQDAVDTDIDTILKIFTSSVRDHESKLGAMQSDQRAADSLGPEARTQQSVQQGPGKKAGLRQSSSQPSTGISLPTDEMVKHQSTSRAEARGEHKPQPAEQVYSGPNSIPGDDQSFLQTIEGRIDEPQLWSPFGGQEESSHVPSDRGTRSLLREDPELEPKAISAPFAANTDDPLPNEPSKDAVPEDPIDQYLLQTAPPSQAVSQLEASIQSAVRARMLSLSAALEAAATSTTQRGDTAMWEVVESQIFSLAQHFQPPTTQQLRRERQPFGGISKFTFSREKSDKPSQMIEAAERAAGRLSRPSPSTAAPVPGSTNPAPSGAITAPENANVAIPPPAEPLPHHDLQILQHIYPAALLLALRLYITHFPSSPYAFLLLPRIRALGTTSYVLGASPQFYNNLMSLVWLVRSSLREVDGLLGEMDRGGVEMDEGTYAVLGAIEEARTADLEREKRAGTDSMQGGDIEGMAAVDGEAEANASRGAAWWKRQEQMLFFPRVLDWLDVIAGRLAAKERASVV
ncbi:hypothetical protein G647_04184 [Cladophialophora carrionii CBS 160.54]|uniref:Mtf2-like C-terminal domain-containing protein n=1 Tax=Cladophialophora carrionii CBS 160.54 TaxID=1279043 RepID=V9DD32_9EURO|nr:uncharacterized protein G647_04184 [Cladophialophora carrionii CBS 160.54]ETI24814.1 hypothetical protein G647_04184 [Cladophialophora carrionii CBS 160.54]